MDLQTMIVSVLPLDEAAMVKARERQVQLAKPPGSLGRLEDLSVQLAGITGKVHNKIEKKHLLNIIDALLAEAKEDEYNLVDSDYSEIYTSFANLIFYLVSSEYFKATLIYSKIKLKHLMEYTK